MHWCSVITAVVLCSACASTSSTREPNVAIDFPSSAPVDNIKQAEAVLASATLARAQIEWRYQRWEQVCFTRFFMNACLLDAKNQRRVDLARVKKSEVDANYFKRKYTVEEMDKALAEKNKKNPLPEDK